MGAKMMTKADRDMKVPDNQGLLSTQTYGGDDQYDRPDVEAALVEDTKR